jgi:hypothetical protein
MRSIDGRGTLLLSMRDTTRTHTSHASVCIRDTLSDH